MLRFRFDSLLPGFLLLVTVLASPADARQAGRGGGVQVQTGAAQPTPDARQTRAEFENVLRRLPPAVGRILRIEPTLLRNQELLQSHPPLAEFLETHPEVAASPDFYLERVDNFLPPVGRPVLQTAPPDPRTEAIRVWRGAIEGFTVLLVVVVITAAVAWVIRSLIEWRRWNRTSRIQAEVHTTLIERFTTNEELLAYMQTPAGRGFLEASPLPIEPPGRPLAAPFSRILWSVQAGVVLAVAAVGLLFISSRVIEEVAEMLFAAGVIVLAIGIGFVLSAGASLLLSRRLGLLDVKTSVTGTSATEA